MTDQNITVNITVSSSAITRQGFGEPLIAAYHTYWPELVKQFSTLEELTTAGVATSHPVYRMASALLNQNPRVPTFKVGKRATVFTAQGRLTPTVTTEGTVVGCTVIAPDGSSTVVSHTNGASETVATIVASLQASLTAITGITATNATTHVAWSADNAGETWYFHSFTGGLEVLYETTDPGIAADLGAIYAEDPDWYGLTIDSVGGAEVQAAAAWALANKKLFGATVCDHEILDNAVTTDVASDLKGTSNTHAFTLFSTNPHQYPATAWQGVMLPKASGDATWAFKTLAGVSIESMTTSEKNNALAKLCNIYTTRGGTGRTFEGLTASAGRFIDQTRGLDELQVRIREDLEVLLNSQDKVNYTDSGISAVDATVRATLGGFTVPRRNFLASFTTTVPKASEVSATDKSNRRLTMSFSAEGAGAIHGITVNGTVTI